MHPLFGIPVAELWIRLALSLPLALGLYLAVGSQLHTTLLIYRSGGHSDPEFWPSAVATVIMGTIIGCVSTWVLVFPLYSVL